MAVPTYIADYLTDLTSTERAEVATAFSDVVASHVGTTILYDDFLGTVAAIGGRVPDFGPAWSVTGSGAANVEAGGGEMYTTGSSTYYAVSAMPQQPVEIGCLFTMTDVWIAMNLGGTFSSGKQLVIQVTPSRSATTHNVFYTTQAGDTDLAGAATSFAAAINANANMIANGITATANGTRIELRATECPYIAGTSAPFPMSSSTLSSGSPTLSSYVTGGNFLNGMVHLTTTVNGSLDWKIYILGNTAMTNMTATSIAGLKANTDYIYRCVIQPPNVSGTLSIAGGPTIATAFGSDDRVTTLAGNTSFWEGNTSSLRFKKVWATKVANQITG